MQSLKAQVKNGRLILDEPTELPEGEVVYLQLVEGIADDGLDDAERAALHNELEASIAEADEVIAQLRQRA
jgi:hypothetical protein